MINTRTLIRNGTEASALERRLGRLFNDAFGAPEWPAGDHAAAPWVPPVDIVEEAGAIRLLVEVPGVNPDQVKISVENNVLTIHGTKQQVAAEHTERVHRYERNYGAFQRTFTLPTTVDPEGITAAYEHGVLTVTLPKAEKARPRQIEVKVAAK